MRSADERVVFRSQNYKLQQKDYYATGLYVIV